MLNSPVALFLNIKAVVLRRSISMTASDTLECGNVDAGFGDDRRERRRFSSAAALAEKIV